MFSFFRKKSPIPPVENLRFAERTNLIFSTHGLPTIPADSRSWRKQLLANLEELSLRAVDLQSSPCDQKEVRE